MDSFAFSSILEMQQVGPWRVVALGAGLALVAMVLLLGDLWAEAERARREAQALVDKNGLLVAEVGGLRSALAEGAERQRLLEEEKGLLELQVDAVADEAGVAMGRVLEHLVAAEAWAMATFATERV